MLQVQFSEKKLNLRVKNKFNIAPARLRSDLALID